MPGSTRDKDTHSHHVQSALKGKLCSIVLLAIMATSSPFSVTGCSELT